MGKNILVVAATAKEIEPFLEIVRQNSGLIAGHTIDVLISGIGLTSATYHLSRQVILKRSQLIIQAGVAGCFDKKMALGSVVAVKQDTIADESVIELKKLKTIFDLKLVPQNKFPYSGGWLINKNNVLSKIKLKKVKGISVNQITSSKQVIAFYKNDFDPVVESMEGAALHYVASSEKIPFIQLRSISNYIGERNKKNWDMKNAIINLNKELIRLLENI
ncbi:MAG: futalosine hydrolase [Chitinophagaceae bacterium]|nr:futalosine hydrolase [Chitinophagaceae bacterium]